jgi:hypothetical protein
MKFQFKNGLDSDLYGRIPDHMTPARAINKHVGTIVVVAYGNGIFGYLKVIDKAAWEKHIAPHVAPTSDNYLELTLPETET